MTQIQLCLMGISHGLMILLGHQPAIFLLFKTSNQQKHTLWTIDIDGSNQQKVLEDSTNIIIPYWSKYRRSYLLI